MTFISFPVGKWGADWSLHISEDPYGTISASVSVCSVGAESSGPGALQLSVLGTVGAKCRPRANVNTQELAAPQHSVSVCSLCWLCQVCSGLTRKNWEVMYLGNLEWSLESKWHG